MWKKASVTRAETGIVAAILALAFAVRLYYMKAFVQPALSGDAANYVAMVKRWVATGIYSFWGGGPDAYVTPGYPTFLAFFFRWFDGSSHDPLIWVYGAQIMLSTLTVFGLYLIGRRVCNSYAGYLAGLAYALYPTAIWASALILTETLYIFLFTGYVYLFLVGMDRESRKWTAAAGFVLGLTVLVRPAVAPLAIMPLIYWLLVRRVQGPIKLTIWHLAPFVIVMLPWWIRNTISLGHFVALATQTGNPFLAGTDPYFTEGERLFKNLQGVDQQALGWQRIREGLATHPSTWIMWFTVGKLRVLFNDLWVVPHGRYFDMWQHLHQWGVYLGFSSLLLYVKNVKIRPLLLFVLIPTALQLMFLPLTRYGFVMMPLLMVLAAVVIVYLATPQRGEQPLEEQKDRVVP
ncbi:ArnT family glycosyltransferase [Tumebacillus permanentifrigoris]|uniref:Dolichyl-phosphate-mannose-protein mannosyltransferase n=1 Tax=Tumebacillus permanentifrigoris TaxID=378543 RepID=A0A316D845_9BACL|nr:glycosyltransferase family 39 protein [Tumebacillus permanentifrigoris]PWK13019.1 dolichyl-phosphate-mannose-protein mannosyltransferase [Tumebacillus permanentifrigoris]